MPGCDEGNPTVYRPPWPAHLGRAIERGGRLDGVRALHGRWRCTRRAWATTRAATASSARCRVGQRLHHRAGDDAAVRPHAGAPGGAGAGRLRQSTRCGSSAPAAARWRCSCSMRWAKRVRRYTIVDLSGALRARQQATLGAFGDRVRWVDALPDAMRGRGGRQRGARRHAGGAAALGRRTLARARRRALTAAASRSRTATRRCGRRSRRPSRPAPPSRSIRRRRLSSPRWPSG